MADEERSDGAQPTKTGESLDEAGRSGGALSPATAAWLVDAARHKLTWCNEEGAAAWGLDEDGWVDLPLDAAMPAWQTIEAFARSSAAAATHDLIVWTRNGLQHGRYDMLRFIPTNTAARAGEALVWLEPAEPGRPAREQPAPLRDGAAAISNRSTNVDADILTLQEIARRIMSGRHGERPRERQADGIDSPESGGEIVPPPPDESVQTLPDRQALSLPGLAQVSHELRTPLAAIASLSEVLRDETFGPIGDVRYRSYAADIATSAHHALAVVATMLTNPVSTANQGATGLATGVPEPEPVTDVASAIETALTVVRPLALRRSVALDFDAARPLPRVRAAPTAIEQILVNLLTNAVRFSHPGGSVAVAVTLTPGRDLEVRVTDRGEGMEPGALRTANAGSEVDARENGEHGLGLFIAHQLASRCGARLAFSSRIGEGTCAVLALPADRTVVA